MKTKILALIFFIFYSGLQAIDFENHLKNPLRPSFGFVDIDNDKDLDLFVGKSSGNIYYYENIGSSQKPNFFSGIMNPFYITNVGVGALPCFVDIDNDKDLDLFVAVRSGNIYYFENIGSPQKPNFISGIMNPFYITNVGVGALPCFVDIDNDKDLDLFVAVRSGNIYYFENIGSPHKPNFFSGIMNPFYITNVGVGALPCFVDIDNDKDLDLFVAVRSGNIYYFENIGSPQKPNFFSGIMNPFYITNVGAGALPCFVDIDNDKDLDLFVAVRSGNIYYFENIGSPQKPNFISGIMNPF